MSDIATERQQHHEMLRRLQRRLELSRCVICGHPYCKTHTVGEEKRYLFSLLAATPLDILFPPATPEDTTDG